MDNGLDFENGVDVDLKTTSINLIELFDKVDFLLDDDLNFNHNEVTYNGDPLLDINGNTLTVYSTYNGYDKVTVKNEDDYNYTAMLITQALNNIEAEQELENDENQN